MIADGAGTPGQSAATLLLLAAALFAWIAVARLRGRGFGRLPRCVGWVSACLVGVCVILGLLMPNLLQPPPSAVRPRSSASLSIDSPRPGQLFTGDPAKIPVRLALAGGRIVAFTSTHLTSNEGHIHLFLDDSLVSMTYGVSATIFAPPGHHVLMAEFVAVDHGPFEPPVEARVAFTVKG